MFAQTKVLYENSKIKIFSNDFSSNDILSTSKYSTLIMSSKLDKVQMLILISFKLIILYYYNITGSFFIQSLV